MLSIYQQILLPLLLSSHFITITMIINRYGKAESRPGRKMAHFTVTGSSFNDLADKMDMIGITEHNIKRSGAYTIIVISSLSLMLSSLQKALKLVLLWAVIVIFQRCRYCFIITIITITIIITIIIRMPQRFLKNLI